MKNADSATRDEKAGGHGSCDGWLGRADGQHLLAHILQAKRPLHALACGLAGSCVYSPHSTLLYTSVSYCDLLYTLFHPCSCVMRGLPGIGLHSHSIPVMLLVVDHERKKSGSSFLGWHEWRVCLFKNPFWDNGRNVDLNLQCFCNPIRIKIL
jgi:hypothetical protein